MDWKRRSVLVAVGILVDQVMVALSVHQHWSISARWLPVGSTSWLVAAILLGCAWFLSPKVVQSSIGWSIVTAGLISNLGTILTRGHVVDYIPLGPWITNIADFLVVGGLLVVLLSFRKPKITP